MAANQAKTLLILHAAEQRIRDLTAERDEHSARRVRLQYRDDVRYNDDDHWTDEGLEIDATPGAVSTNWHMVGGHFFSYRLKVD